MSSIPSRNPDYPQAKFAISGDFAGKPEFPWVVVDFSRDSEGEIRVRGVSPSVSRIMDCSAEELALALSHKTLPGIHPEDEEAFTNALLDSDNDCEDWAHEFRLLSAKGAVRRFRLLAAVHSEGGHVIYRACFLDISNEKEAMLSLHAKNMQLREACEMADLGFWEYHLASGELVVAPEMRKVLKAYDALLPDWRSLSSLFAVGDARLLNNAFNELCDKGISFDLEVRLQGPAWQSDWVRMQGNAVYSGGRLTGARGYCQNVTRLHRMEQEREAFQAEYQALFHRVDVGLMVHGLHGEILDANPAACRMLGISRDQLLTRSSQDGGWDVVHGDGEPFLEEDIPAIRALKTRRPVKDILMGVRTHPDRDRIWLTVSADPELINGNRLRSVTISFKDVSVLREAQSQASKAQWEAEQANQSKSNFLSMMSHELRTPLNPIIGWAELLLENCKDRTQKQALESIHSSGKHLLDLIGDILELSKLEAPHVDIRNRWVILRDFLSESLRSLEAKARLKGLEFKLIIEEELAESFFFDPSMVRLALNSLVSNAIKFTAKGWVGVKVFSRGNQMFFEVRDTGEGIPRNKQKKIFDAFSQGHSVLTRHYGGTGLGLSIADRLARHLNGAITVDSTPQVGSTFLFSFPLVRQDLRPRKAPADKNMTSPSYLPSQPTDGPPILVVEDQLDNQVIAKAMLARMGKAAVIASSGEEACQLAAEKHFSLVLLDIQMPDMDGYETIGRLRKLDRMKAVPVLALTAHALPEDRAKARNAGFDGYIVKPVTYQVFQDSIDKAFAGLRWV